MKIIDFKWLNFLEKYRSLARHNLSNSGMPEPDLKALGINVEYETYLKETGDLDAELRDAIAKRYGVDRDNVILTNGGTEAIFLASAFLSATSDIITVPFPEYEPIFLVPEAMGSRVRRVRLESMARADTEGESLAISLPNNPTGKYEDIADIVTRIGGSYRHVYIDETFHDFTDDRRVSLYDGSKNMIISNTMTKFYGLSSLRVGWIISHKDNIAAMRKIKDLTTINNARFSLFLAKQAIERWSFFRERTHSIVRKNAEKARRELSDFEFYSEKYEGAPFLFVGNGNFDSEKMATTAVQKYGLLVAPGSYFGLDGYLRVCITAYDAGPDLSAFREFAEKERLK
ncbi:pyridoxal phosphate-dependent aminotransferase [Thermoplasma sp.]|uniref:pyridoxal phosphate-dependent aminotransferase n=1 Tax=Thermoplasma sp. TaxID=1973142 RepID=UPI00128005CA|nr:pyridoxal phosphate-dependent aminotransferase [Thermoplasma sp.]KAA8922976.1 MAG: pyridoxal phosphate-dependent aminotransferase [Thermoplasma sp.]